MIDVIKPEEAEKRVLEALQHTAREAADVVLAKFNSRIQKFPVPEQFEVRVGEEPRRFSEVYRPITTDLACLLAVEEMVRSALAEAGWKCSVALKTTRLFLFWEEIETSKPAVVFTVNS